MHLHFTWKDMIHLVHKFWWLLMAVTGISVGIWMSVYTINQKTAIINKNIELENTLKQVKAYQLQLLIEKSIADRLPKNLSVGDYILIVKGVYAASRTYDIPVDTILAIIEVESDFQKDAVSLAGAKGLMQLMEGTANQMSKAYGLSPDRDDPYNNIQLGTCLLRHLINYYTAKKVPMTAIWIYTLHAYASGKDYEPGSSTQYSDRVEKAKARSKN